MGVDGFVSVDSASGVEAPAYVIDPKNDRRGVGYDAFVGAEEFRAAAGRNRLAKERENAGLARGRTRGGAFGVGAFEEEDECLYTEDEIERERARVGGGGRDSRDGRRRRASGAVLALGATTVDGCLVRGFQVSSDTIAPKWFEPPVVPRDAALALNRSAATRPSRWRRLNPRFRPRRRRRKTLSGRR